ncbi:MAG: hypothetical protein ACI4RH_03395 [Huintestinicola sp.]
MKLEIEINEKQERFLRQFAEKQREGSEDNKGTCKPLHLVQTKVLKYKYDGGGNGDFDCYINTDDWGAGIYLDEKSVVLEYGEYGKAEDVMDYETACCYSIYGYSVDSEKEYFELYGIDSDIIKCSVDIEYETKAYFFTLENAREYLKYQAHNLNEPRIFTVGCGYGNVGEYESFYDLLMNIGTQLLGGDEK